MPESRDRISRSEDISSIFSRRRETVRETGILPDEESMTNLFGTPRAAVTMATPRRVAVAGRGGPGGIGRVRFGTPRTGSGGNRDLSRLVSIGRENLPTTGSVGRGQGRGRGRVSNSVLPRWYPRTPLRDITAVVRGIERRRARLSDLESQRQIEGSPLPVIDIQVVGGAHLEHDSSMRTPRTVFPIKRFPQSTGKVLNIFCDNNQNGGESEFLTPQKRLLEMVDTVEKIVLEDLQKLKRTPSAKKAERERKTRILRSMR